MTRLRVEVRPGPGVGGYSLYVDGLPATMGAHHKGEVACAGRCGDGSLHALLYSFAGLPGASLAIIVRCPAGIVCALRAEIAGATGSRSRAGREVFAI
jgi:hypothetical protein